MKRIVGLIFGGWVLAASAQVPGLLFGALIQGLQGTQTPSFGELSEMKRQSEEMTTLQTEIARLKRLGRFAEAEALNRRLSEVMSSGPLGRMMNEGMRNSREMQQQLPPGSPQGGPSVENVRQIGQLTAVGLLNERNRLENDAVFQGQTLFVRPVMTASDQQDTSQAPMSMEGLQLMLEGLARMTAKDYDAAEQSLAKAYSLSPSSTIIQLMVQLDVQRGRGDAALRRLQLEIDALEKADPRSGAIASMLWLQASIHNTAGAYSRAVEACERALAIVSTRSNTTAEYATAQNNLGVALQLGGNTARALEYYERGFAVLQSGRRNAPPESSQKYQLQMPAVAANIGLAKWQLGDHARATDSFRIAVEERALYEIMGNTLLTERGQLAKAQAVAVELHAFLTLEQAVGSKGLGLQMLLERKGALLEQRTRAQASFRRDAQVQAEPPPSEPLQSGPLGLIGRLFGSPITREQATRQRGGDPAARQRAEDQDLLREYDAVVQERAAMPRTQANAARIANLDTRIEVMQMNMRTDRQQVRNTQIEFAAISREQGYDPKKSTEAILALQNKQQQTREQTAKGERASLISRVQASVPKDAVLLEMVHFRPLDPRSGLAEDRRWGPARYGAYIIHSEGEARYVDLGEAGPLDKLIAQFRAALADPSRAAARDLGRRLDEALMRPVRSRLGNALTLYVAPEGALNLIPLGALVDEKGSYLLERYTINYLASGRDLLYLGRNNPARSRAIIMADPAFDEKAAGSSQPADSGSRRSVDFRSVKFDRLPGTAAEAQVLKGILPDAAVLNGTAATKTALKKIAGPRILHIATHGFFLEDLRSDSEDPMLRSGLVFAGVNAVSSADDDGVLTALEASNLDLRGTKLVVLSACETGLGDVKNGEGVFGLRRAFVVAGAESLLMSLWQVSDDATKDLMTSYYTLLSRGETRAEALRQTQIAMLRNPDTAHPFFWAAFISSGETGNLK